MVITGIALILAVSSLLLVWVRAIMTSIRILSLQSLVLAIACLLFAAQTGLAEMAVMAVLTVVVKAAAIPGILSATMKRINIKREAEKFIGRDASLLLAAGLLLFGYVIAGKLDDWMTPTERTFLPVAIAMLLIGLFVMMTHKKAIMQGIGLIVIENGLFLFALSMASGMPFMVEIGIFLDILVSVVLISILSYRMDQTFKSISTDWLRKLKG